MRRLGSRKPCLSPRRIRKEGLLVPGSQAGISKRLGHECSAPSLGAEPLSDLVGVLAPGQVHPGKSLAFGRRNGEALLGACFLFQQAQLLGASEKGCVHFMYSDFRPTKR